MSSGVTLKGLHGARTTRRMAKRAGSWYSSTTRRQSRRMAASSSQTRSGGRPPWLSPRLMLPRAPWKRTPTSAAAWNWSSRRLPLGQR